MIQPARETHIHKITVSDYRLMAEGPPYYQLIDGELFMTPSPNTPHQDIVLALAATLRAHANAHKLGRVFVAPCDVYLSEHDVVQPDVLFAAAQGATRIEHDGVHGPPELVVEVLSPSTRSLDLNRKRARYAGFGVTEAWFVDLDAELVLVFLLQKNAAQPAQSLGRGATLSSALLPGFEIAVSDVLDAK